MTTAATAATVNCPLLFSSLLRLTKLTAILREICPSDANIGFEFDGKLHLNVQLRRFEDVTRVETALPSLCGMIFHDIRHGQVGRHSFLHRVSALVAR